MCVRALAYACVRVLIIYQYVHKISSYLLFLKKLRDLIDGLIIVKTFNIFDSLKIELKRE
jgi:hypothetical protein